MKHISLYEKAVVITLQPNPLKHLATLRIEINPREFERDSYKSRFDKLLHILRDSGFGATTDKNLSFNSTELFNVMEVTLPTYISEVQVARDIEEEVKKLFGDDSVLNRVMIKEKLKK